MSDLRSDLNAAPSERTDVLRNAVGATCHRLQNNYFSTPSSREYHVARASLAQMRRNASIDIKRNPLGLATALFEMGGDFDTKLAGKGDEPSPSERAAYTALTLFAVHMQSATSPVHVPSVSFATACGRLHALGISDSIKPRIDAMLLAGSESSRIAHIRSLIALLRTNDLGFDYGLLARDLRGLANPKTKSGIQLRWGRDFAHGYFAGTKSGHSDTVPDGAAHAESASSGSATTGAS
ncbi:type I-E CRISPR-associated protein Cse2/CasB [Corynebacterium anserum]|uniref:Type I-E CRISPR-associated protein Cse2/CasB n=1 Tax=Corynebacterium anserum TaxID=2684406 RepID=A0A7G7YLR7_9CORY|nr:type I-E CRISPR-associated protein Cse2/CasB [Corynebacterium anserum]MBC2681399.1 type I-E CRISPR-associated protein Cse2/CasB [Corynebacterium anserum]QNH95437.1 type I-E CRISPR-associated protein Cse2/CasB [Corynebacterium anserum]